MTWDVIAALMGALGGIELLKWLFPRKSGVRKEQAEAKAAEFATLQDMIIFLQQQLKEKEERFADQTLKLRKTIDELFAAKAETSEAKIELAIKKCEDKDCPFREPPTAYTKPKPGITKEQYHARKALS